MTIPCYQCRLGNYRAYRAAVYGECIGQKSCDDWRKWEKWKREQSRKGERDSDNDGKKQG